MEDTSQINLHLKLVDLEKKVIDSNHPQDFWEDAITLAHEEETMSGSLYLPEIKVEEIISFGNAFKELSTAEDKYRFMMQSTESGNCGTTCY